MRTPVMPFRSAVPVAAWTVAASILLCAGAAHAQPAPAPTAVTYMAQNWSATDRETFYTTSQGSHLIRAAWFKALRRLDVDQPFAADQLARYGYLRNDSPNNRDGLPVGFVVETRSGQLGMTCAACHTGQLEYSKDGVNHVWRIDGAPASADFQQFLHDLVAAARATLSQSDRFDAFAKAVLGRGYSAANAASLKAEFGEWLDGFGTFMDASLPPSPWGTGRLDAFGMIFNRVAGLDLNIAGNIKFADAPVSYPFLWNASRQDRTQWNGAVKNGLLINGLGRNAGEVLGVFADFKPISILPRFGLVPPTILYNDNSVDLTGLEKLEEEIVKLQPPPWQTQIFGLNDQLVKKGEALFDQNCAHQCHEEIKSSDIVGLVGAWATPVQPVKTDPKMANNAGRISASGIYEGAPLPRPAIPPTFSQSAAIVDVLGNSVVQILIAGVAQAGAQRAVLTDLSRLQPGATKPLDTIPVVINFINTQLTDLIDPPKPGPAAYEARVLHGIWATAPYLHNGSVPSLWELLKPAKDRVTTFNVGCRRFDPKNVGFVSDDPSCKTGTFTVDPNNANGNGNGGHEFGTNLSEDDRWAIVEFLKQY
jgi:hypothetical protein